MVEDKGGGLTEREVAQTLLRFNGSTLALPQIPLLALEQDAIHHRLITAKHPFFTQQRGAEVGLSERRMHGALWLLL